MAGYLLHALSRGGEPAECEPTVVCDLTLNDLGGILGMTSETACRVLSNLKSRGIVETVPAGFACAASSACAASPVCDFVGISPAAVGTLDNYQCLDCRRSRRHAPSSPYRFSTSKLTPVTTQEASMAIDFTLSAEQKVLQATAREFARRC